MSTLVSDLNDVTRIEANRMRLDFQAQTVSEVVDETIRSLRKQIEDKGQNLVLSLPGDLPRVWVDRTRLGQVLINLISNAYKYTTPGGTITVAAEASDNQWDPLGARRVVHLWVQDTGIGISPEDQKKIFQKFFRSEDPKTREAPGTGRCGRRVQLARGPALAGGCAPGTANSTGFAPRGVCPRAIIPATMAPSQPVVLSIAVKPVCAPISRIS